LSLYLRHKKPITLHQFHTIPKFAIRPTAHSWVFYPTSQHFAQDRLRQESNCYASTRKYEQSKTLEPQIDYNRNVFNIQLLGLGIYIDFK